MLYPQHLPTIHQPHKAKCNETKQNAMSMVDVGNKAPTSRFAKARCTVTFPPEVITAFFNNHGSKGPIFETARLAGIMDA
jgi:molybdenum cofactor biosynthesis enzyme